MRLTWVQPEDLVAHAFVAARLDGVDVDDLAERWRTAGGSLLAPVSGAGDVPADGARRALASQLLTELDSRQRPPQLLAAEPDLLAEIERAAARDQGDAAPAGIDRDIADSDIADRVLGAWLGRAAGCLLGKPVEKLPRAGIEELARSTGNWPIAGYFTAVGLDPAVAGRFPWNRRSAPTSLAENIDGMPEDDDLNFALIALTLVERFGDELTTDDVAQAWLELVPGGRVFTAERIVYRNLLAGIAPAEAATVGNPFQDWIGAQIRADVYGWVSPGRPRRAARLAWTDAMLSHRRNGVYGAMFVAAASAQAVAGRDLDDCIDAGLAVVPPASRYAAAVRRGRELGADASLSVAAALDVLADEYGGLHWVHVLNNAALVAFALTRSAGDFTQAITLAVTGGWDTDSNGATVGALCGALCGAAALPPAWTEPLRNRLASTVADPLTGRSFDGIGFDELARRTVELSLRSPATQAARTLGRGQAPPSLDLSVASGGDRE